MVSSVGGSPEASVREAHRAEGQAVPAAGLVPDTAHDLGAAAPEIEHDALALARALAEAEHDRAVRHETRFVVPW